MINEKLDWDGIVAAAVKRRTAEGLSQRDLASFTGLSLPTVNKFEQGRRDITLSHVLQILKFLGLAV